MKERRKQGKTRTIEKGSEGSRTGGDVINGLECPLYTVLEKERERVSQGWRTLHLKPGSGAGFWLGFVQVTLYRI